MTDYTNNFIHSFGRRGGRPLKSRGAELFNTLLPNISIGDDLSNILIEANKYDQIWLEIGFGGGEHIAHRAKQNPNILFIGCEVYIQGIASLLAEIEDNNIQNIRIYNDDARLLMEKLPKEFLNRVFILFPDPWPKIRHHKRRIINNEFLKVVSELLKENGQINIATDHMGYAEWIMVYMSRCKDLLWIADNQSDWQNAPENHIVTRYQQKNKANSVRPVFLNFRKNNI